ncbi:MAG: hypothetical protein A2X48_15330 [Lentisphaerae bacterium GWF2_49_21]|nr:MAG: hypothetical protein A2X48_15330 [Lentisphaerae bacterium GWF2_49_21]
MPLNGMEMIARLFAQGKRLEGSALLSKVLCIYEENPTEFSGAYIIASRSRRGRSRTSDNPSVEIPAKPRSFRSDSIKR